VIGFTVQSLARVATSLGMIKRSPDAVLFYLHDGQIIRRDADGPACLVLRYKVIINPQVIG
jgi:hypothetical protein